MEGDGWKIYESKEECDPNILKFRTLGIYKGVAKLTSANI
jgi:hypothetical protein